MVVKYLQYFIVGQIVTRRKVQFLFAHGIENWPNLPQPFFQGSCILTVYTIRKLGVLSSNTKGEQLC